MKSILFVTNNLATGGVEKILNEIIKNLKLNPIYKIEILSFSKTQNISASFINLRVPIHNSTFFNKINNKLNTIFGYLRLISFVRKSNYDIIFTFNRNTSFIFLLIKPFYKSSLIIRDSSSSFYSYNFIIKQYFSFILSKYKIPVVQLSETGAKQFKTYFKYGEIKIINNGIMFSNKPFKTKNFFPLRFVMLANFFFEKNHFFLVNAWKIIEDKMKGLATLTIIGNDYGTGILEKIQILLNDTNSVTIIQGKELNDINLNNFDIGLLTSKEESFGNVILEYIDNELPVICSNTYGAIEILGKDYEYLYKSDDYRDFFNKIDLLLKSKDLIHIGKKLKESIKERFSYNNFINSYNSLINKCL